MATELFSADGHQCIAFSDLVKGDGIQSNQFLIIDGEQSALLDPGGALTYTPLSMAMSQFVRPKELTYVFASHQDPDIIASIDRWFTYTDCKIVVSKLWGRFVPHLVPGYMEGKAARNRYILLPDAGMDIQLGSSIIKTIPAHFLHSVGNFQFYDTKSKILFSGDMGASISDAKPDQPVDDFDAHLKAMEGFHRRYMGCNKVCRLWADMVTELDVEMMVPQHGQPFVGREMIDRFLEWISELQCGTDLVTPMNYQIP